MQYLSVAEKPERSNKKKEQAITLLIRLLLRFANFNFLLRNKIKTDIMLDSINVRLFVGIGG